MPCQPLTDMEEAYEFSCNNKDNEDIMRSYLEEHTLDLLPCLFDDLCLPTTRDSFQTRKDHAAFVLQNLLKYGSPKETTLALENQLGVAMDEITQCFYVNEDEDASEGERDVKQAEETGEEAEKTLSDVQTRILLALNTHMEVLSRLRYKKSTAASIMVKSFVDRLDQLLPELLQALHAGEAISAEDVRELLSTLAVWCRSVFEWVDMLQPSSDEVDNLRTKLIDFLLKYLVLFHPRMKLELLERGYQALFPKAMLSRRRAETGTAADDGKGLVDCKDALMGTLATLGLSAEGHVEWMNGTKRDSVDNHFFYPTAALILSSWQLVDSLDAKANPKMDSSVPFAIHDQKDMLTVSLPILGSALNGIAKDAGHIWIWYIAHQMQSEGHPADRDDVSMLLELVMPNLADNPSDVSRFALHRLIATLVSLVEDPKDRIALYEQLVSPENPFLPVRLSSLALLREEISASLRSADESIVHQDSFWHVLAPIMFSVPDTDPALQELSIEQALQELTVPWLTECCKILLLLLSPGSPSEQRCKEYVKQEQLQSTWISSINEALVNWEKEDSTEDPGAVEASMLLYSLRWTLEQVEGKLKPDEV